MEDNYATFLKLKSGNISMQLLLALSAIVLLLVISFCWKRRRLYQLASKLPGPKWFPILGSLDIGLCKPTDIANSVFGLMNDYQSPAKIWLGTELVIIVSRPDQIQTVLTNSKALSKAPVYKFMKAWLGDGLLTSTENTWRRHKKIISPIFNPKILNSFVEIFTEKSNLLVKLLEKKADTGYFDIFKYISPCTLDIVCETMMGVNLNVQTEDVKFVKQLELALEYICKRIFNPVLHLDFICKLVGLKKKIDSVETYVNQFSDKIIKNKKSLLKERNLGIKSESETDCIKRKGLLDLLLDMDALKTSNLTDVEIREEVNTFVTAANETSANVTCFIFMIMGIYKDVQQKVYEELVDVLGDINRPITHEDLSRLEYMERVIKETMRLIPIVPLIGRHLLGEMQVGDKLLPANCTIAICTDYMHKDPKVWPEPEKFNPDRFLPQEISKRHPYSYIPFGGGPRICIGTKYAMMSVKVIVASIVRNYQMECDYKLEDIKLIYSLVTRPVDGYKIKLSTRKS